MLLLILQPACSQRSPQPPVGSGVPAPASAPTAAAPAQPIAAPGSAVVVAPALPPRDYARDRASIAEAARSGRHPERMSPEIAPVPFDPVAYQRDPEAYLATVEPGRIHQTHPEAPGVPWLESASPLDLDLPYLGSTQLVVRGQPGAPVTFVTYDMGLFDNGLPAISVRADAQGIARVTWRSQPGVTQLVNILVGSPATSGQVHFRLNVATPSESQP